MIASDLLLMIFPSLSRSIIRLSDPYLVDGICFSNYNTITNLRD